MINDSVMHALRHCPLFSGMSEVSIELALGSIAYQIVSLEKRDVYALAGMPCRFADIVVKGSLVCRMASISGKQVEVSRLQAGDIVAPQTLQQLMDKAPDIRMNFIQTLSNIDVFLTHKMKVLSLFTVREKVAYLLLETAGEQNSNTIKLQRSRQEIANSFGIQKFSLLRVLNAFEKEGAIRIAGETIEILHREKLK